MALNPSYSAAQINSRVVATKTDAGIGNNASNCPAMSGDGRYTIFESDATNLVSGDTNQRDDLFLYDAATKSVRRLSQTPAGVQQQGGQNPITCNAGISRDGTTVVYATDGTGLVPEATTAVSRVYAIDVATGAIELLVPAGLTDGAFFPSINQDGSRVTFASTDTVLNAGANGISQIYLIDRNTDTITLMTSDGSGNPAGGNTFRAAISADGAWIALESAAVNLKGASYSDDQPVEQILLHDITGDTNILVSRTLGGAPGNAASRLPSISAAGTQIAYFSEASDILASDTNGEFDVFLYERGSASTELITVSSDEKQFQQFSEVFINALSSDGNLVVFRSQDPKRKRFGLEVFVRDRAEGITYLATFSNSCGGRISNDRSAGSIAPDAPTVALSSGRDFPRSNLQIVLVGIDQLQRVDTPPSTLDQIDADVCKDAVTLSMTPFIAAASIPGATISYDTKVRSLSTGSQIRRQISKRNEFTLQKVPPGRYAASYSVRIRTPDGEVQRSRPGGARRFAVN